MTEIKFYLREDEYGFLSNFERTPFQDHDGIWWPTNEHFYQAHMTQDETVRKYIREAPHAWYAMILGRNIKKGHERAFSDTRDFKLQLMLAGLRLKFQNQDLKKKLLDTGDATLHEDDTNFWPPEKQDKFWGIVGEDWLGKLLMQVRDELKTSALKVTE